MAGWNGSDRKGAAPVQPKATAKKPSPIRGLIAGGAVVVLAAVAYFVFFSGSEKPQKVEAEKTASRIKEVKPAAAPVYKEEAPDTNAIAAARRAKQERIKKMSPDERWNYFLEQAKKMPLDLTPRTNQIFRTSTEQMMAMVFGTKLGDPPPRLPNIPLREQVHFAEILIADNPIAETDSEKVKQTKETLAAAKKELMKFIKEGGDADQFFDYYRGELQQARDEWLETQKSVFKVIKDDPDIAEVYINEVNDRLSQKGIKPVMVPPKLKEKLGQK